VRLGRALAALPRRGTAARNGVRAITLAAATAGVFLVLVAPAVAASHVVTFVPPMGLFGISVSGILKTIAKLLFNVLAGAFLPGWLKHAPQDALRWLIALPDPADPVQWPTMHRLEQDTTAVAIAFLPLTFAIAVLRYTASSVTGGAHHPAESIGRLLGAAVGLLLFPWGFENAVAAVNVTTSTLLGFASIDHGLQRALTLMFAGGVAFGVTGPVVALLVIGAILLAVGLVMIKVGLLALFAILYVAGPLALAVSPVPELHGVWRMWLGILVALALIPVGWCLIFAVAGAISADITHIGTPPAIGTRLVGFFAGVLTFVIAFRWPFFLIGMIRSRGLLSGEVVSGGGGGTGRSSGSVIERVRQSRAALVAGAGAAGGAISHVGGALGAPGGGLVGASRRLGAKAGGAVATTPLALRGRRGLAASWQTVRARAAGGGGGSDASARQRVMAAGAVAAATPAAVRAAMSERGNPRAARAAAEQHLAGARARGGDPGNKPAATGSGSPPAAPSRQPAARSQPQSPPSAPDGSAGRAAVESAAAAATAAAVGRQIHQRKGDGSGKGPPPGEGTTPSVRNRPLQGQPKRAQSSTPPNGPSRPVKPKGHRQRQQPKQPPPRKEGR
jgi:hypothetical protein